VSTTRHLTSTAAIVYGRVGLNEDAEVYEKIAEEVCTAMTEALQAVSVENQQNPGRLNGIAEEAL